MVRAFKAFSLSQLTITTTCVDADGDSLCSTADNCPTLHNLGQEDTDLDGAGNGCDNCPLTANPGGGVAVFSQTLVAPDKTTFAWPAAQDVLWVLGDIAGVSAYEYSSSDSAAAATTIPSGANPEPGSGSYLLVRADCPLSTWSTGAESECPPGTCATGNRDELLP